jgi:hypothetical protein
MVISSIVMGNVNLFAIAIVTNINDKEIWHLLILFVSDGCW